jgi:Na+/proline symporter
MTWLIPVFVIGIYLAVVLYIGIFAFRKGRGTGEDFFLASRSIGPLVFFLSLFATNMTSVAILGSSGFAYRRGIGLYGMMASASGFVIPLTLFVIGTRLWALGKRFGHMTQVAFFRDRWECSAIGTFLFVLTASMLLPYLIVSVIGGGTILEALTDGHVQFAVGGAIVALVVMGNVFFGGMRGAVLVNVFQTILFLSFGLIAFVVIGHNIPGGFSHTVQDLAHGARVWTLQRTTLLPTGAINERVPQITTTEFLSYCFIPLSSIMFPHMSIMCLTAKKVTSFKKTVILYPLCIMAIWLPCVFLGAIANGLAPINAALAAQSPDVVHWLHPDPAKPMPAPRIAALLATVKTPEAQSLLADVKAHTLNEEQFGKRLLKVVGPLKTANEAQYTTMVVEVKRLANTSPTDSVLLEMLHTYVNPILAGILAAGIISAVMGSDCHQILALSTMFTKDVFDYYGGRKRYGEKGTVFMGRVFIIVANLIAYAIALTRPKIFDLAISWSFSGFAALAPVMLAALFWKRSTKYGALFAGIFVAATILTVGYVEKHFQNPVGTPPTEHVLASLTILGKPALALAKSGRLFIFGFMPVVFMVLGSALCVWIGSLLTAPPSEATIRKYFASASDDATSAPRPSGVATMRA